MDIPKIFIPDNENLLEERIQYLLKEPELPEFEPAELLKINGKLYVALTHPSEVKLEMERNLKDYFSDRFKIIEFVKYKHSQEKFKKR